MTEARRGRGRPRSASRSVLEEAATELFFRQGYDATSIDQIARAAGVSRNTFFNYFDGKSDVLWGGFDAATSAFEASLAATTATSAIAAVRQAALAFAAALPPASVSLAFTQADSMGADVEFGYSRGLRLARLAAAVRGSASRLGRVDPLWAAGFGVATS